MSDEMEPNAAVKVAIRQRPLENPDDNDCIVKYEPKSKNMIIINDQPYCFDYVLDAGVTQKDLFDVLIDPLVESAKKGYNCTALAYGQTGTGKSYTMGLSSEDNDNDQVGVVRRCLWKLIKDIDQYDITASFIEIYNEKAFDLLAPNTIEPIMAKGFKFSGGVRTKITSIEDCNNILKQGISRRHVRPTIMNSQSSRSHVIFTIELLRKYVETPTRAYLNLVDLAGSEGVRRTGHSGVAMSEGVHINQGLLCIGKILKAMSERQKVIPFRDSVLGSVLQDSLNSNSYLTLLACISANRNDLSETLSTIRFAQRAKQLKRTPQMNSILMEINKNKTKTPHNIKFMKKTRNTREITPKDSISTTLIQKPNDGQLYNTFCTPGKIRRIVNNLNYTDIGLTPKEKEKTQRHLITTSTTVKPRLPPKNPQSNVNYTTAQRESLFEHTVESWNLNISSSTTVDPLPSTSLSYSPIVRKCMEKFETIIDNKMLQWVENIQKASTTVSTIPALTPKQSDKHNQMEPSTIRSELKSIMRELFLENEGTTMTSFTTSSPVFKVPENPVRHKKRSSKSQESQANESKDLTMLEESIVHETVRHVRRSTRLLAQNETKNSSINSNDIVSLDSSSRTSLSKKRSSIELLKERRRCIRIAAHLEESKAKVKAKPKSKQNNNIITDYLNESKSLTSSKAHLIKKHRKAILELLNNGSMKELQILPQIGQKTAFQLVTHRTLTGKFKNISHVEKLPIWRGNAWERFATANMLI